MLKVVKEGVYFLYDGEELVYIGQSDNIYRRIGQHISDGVKRFDSFCFYEVGEERIILESYLINKFKPKYNQTCGSTISPWCMYDPVTDVFPDTMPDEKVMRVINECLSGKPKDITLRKIAKLQDVFIESFAFMQMIKHKEELPIYKINGTWYMDSAWYDNNKEELNAMLLKW